jgi:hypothetical protein
VIRVPWVVDAGDQMRLAVGVGVVAAQDGLVIRVSAFARCAVHLEDAVVGRCRRHPPPTRMFRSRYRPLIWRATLAAPSML